MSAELWKSVFDWATVIFIALTVVTGSGALITGSVINRRQEIRLHQFDRDLTDAKTELGKQQERAASLESSNIELRTDLEKAEAEAAKAQLELRRYIDHVDRKAGPRRLDREKFLEQLKNKPTGMAFVRYKPDDMEAYQFATMISSLLETTGWNILGPQPFGGKNARHGGVPFEVTYGGAFGSGVTIKCKNPRDEGTSVKALIDALMCGEATIGGFEVLEDPTLKDDEVHVIIGQKK